MASPVDVDSLPNYVKYCVSVLYLLWANIRTSPVGIPYKEDPKKCDAVPVRNLNLDLFYEIQLYFSVQKYNWCPFGYAYRGSPV